MKKILLIILFVFKSCGGDGTTSGNPMRVDVNLSTYNSTAHMRMNRVLNFVIPTAHAGLTTLTFCIKRMRFKLENSSGSGGSNIDLSLGEVVIKPESTFLSTVEIKNSTYRRVEIDLDSSCSSSNSVEISNSSGDFSTNDSITIRFEGTYAPEDGNLTLFVQSIIDQIKNYDGTGSSIKDRMEATSGSM